MTPPGAQPTLLSLSVLLHFSKPQMRVPQQRLMMPVLVSKEMEKAAKVMANRNCSLSQSIHSCHCFFQWNLDSL